MIDAKQIQRDETPTSIFNPLKRDFKIPYRGEDNLQKEYLIRSMEIETFPAYLAKHIVKHLVTAIQNERDINPISNPESTEEIRKEIEVII